MNNKDNLRLVTHHRKASHNSLSIISRIFSSALALVIVVQSVFYSPSLKANSDEDWIWVCENPWDDVVIQTLIGELVDNRIKLKELIDSGASTDEIMIALQDNLLKLKSIVLHSKKAGYHDFAVPFLLDLQDALFLYLDFSIPGTETVPGLTFFGIIEMGRHMRPMAQIFYSYVDDYHRRLEEDPDNYDPDIYEKLKGEMTNLVMLYGTISQIQRMVLANVWEHENPYVSNLKVFWGVKYQQWGRLVEEWTELKSNPKALQSELDSLRDQINQLNLEVEDLERKMNKHGYVPGTLEYEHEFLPEGEPSLPGEENCVFKFVGDRSQLNQDNGDGNDDGSGDEDGGGNGGSEENDPLEGEGEFLGGGDPELGSGSTSGNGGSGQNDYGDFFNSGGFSDTSYGDGNTNSQSPGEGNSSDSPSGGGGPIPDPGEGSPTDGPDEPVIL